MFDPGIRRHFFLIALLLVTAGAAAAGEPDAAAEADAAAGPDAAARTYENRPGWTWAAEPMEWRPLQTSATSGGVLSFTPGEPGLSVHFARTAESEDVQPPTRYDAVAWNSAGERLEAVEMRGFGSNDGTALRHFLFPAESCPADSIARIGVEELTREGWRTVSDLARARATEQGIRALPFPEVGAPYPFDVQLPDGSPVRAADYAGRVVLFDCWASWCRPCIAAMPHVREAYSAYHGRGLDIIGVNFDMSNDAAAKAIQEHAPDWPHVLAGGSWESIDLWGDITTIRGIPRYFLVGRDGTLRWDTLGATAEELNRRIEECLAE